MQTTLFDSIGFPDFVACGEVKNYKVSLCERNKISGFIRQWHYSKNVNGLTIDYCFKLEDENGKLIGGMIYGKIGMADVWKKYAEKEEDLIELKRLCCIDSTPKNTESYFIGSTLRWLRKNTNIKTVISYADTTYLHEGVIYKASNFEHVGMTEKGRVIMFEGKRYHDKAIRTTNNGVIKPFARRIIKALANEKAFYIETNGKHIYLYHLKKNKT